MHHSATSTFLVLLYKNYFNIYSTCTSTLSLIPDLQFVTTLFTKLCGWYIFINCLYTWLVIYWLTIKIAVFYCYSSITISNKLPVFASEGSWLINTEFFITLRALILLLSKDISSIVPKIVTFSFLTRSPLISSYRY